MVGGSVLTPMVGLLRPEMELVLVGVLGMELVLVGVTGLFIPEPLPDPVMLFGEEGGVLLVDPGGPPLPIPDEGPATADPGGVGMPTARADPPGLPILDAPGEDPGIRDIPPGILEDIFRSAISSDQGIQSKERIQSKSALSVHYVYWWSLECFKVIMRRMSRYKSMSVIISMSVTCPYICHLHMSMLHCKLL